MAQKALRLQPWAVLDLFDRLAIMMLDSRVGRVCIMAAALGTFRWWDGLAKIMHDGSVCTGGVVAAVVKL